MIKATAIHKEHVIEILTNCFDTNKSVNWIVKQDSKRKERVRALIDYSFEVCLNSDLIFLTDDLTGVVLCHLSDDKLPALREAYLSIKFLFTVTGIGGIQRALRREKYVKSFHPEEEYVYIWFIGIAPHEQRKGIGGGLLRHVIEYSKKEQKPVYLETSVEENVPFYEHFGFQVYHVAENEVFGFPLYFLRLSL